MTPNRPPNTPEHADSSNVQSVFNAIASRYDLANHVLSFGVDFHWRKKAVSLMQPLADRRVLDVCCGTGDLTLAFARAGAAQVVGCDFSPQMIQRAKTKETRLRSKGKLPVGAKIDWRVCDCTATGLESQSCHVVSCAFGVRNMADLSAGLTEMHRLLRPGGRVCILEFSLPPKPLVRAAYLAYFRWLMPLLGGLITRRPAAYRYLHDSVRQWHRNTNLPAQLQNAGFRNVQAAPMTCGIATLHVADRPE